MACGRVAATLPGWRLHLTAGGAPPLAHRPALAALLMLLALAACAQTAARPGEAPFEPYFHDDNGSSHGGGGEGGGGGGGGMM